MSINFNEICISAKKAAREFSLLDAKQRNQILLRIASRILESKNEILDANKIDYDNAKESGADHHILDRLYLNEERIDAIVDGVYQVVELEDPLDIEYDNSVRPNGLNVSKISVPLGVIGAIYESRPNVTLDIVALCVKSGNVSILKGGSDTLSSNNAIVSSIHRAFGDLKLNPDIVQFINSSDRKYVDLMLNAVGYIDLIIPRGGSQLVNMVREKSRVPAITGGIGVCHVYVDESADIDKAVEIIYNSKVQRPSVCNALDTVIFNQNINKDIILNTVKKLVESKVEIRADDQSYEILSSLNKDYPNSIYVATDEDWGQEFLSLKLSVRMTDSLENAIEYINNYGGHSEAIISENQDNTARFLKAIDSSAVFVNASTRFNDGGELGLGAEVAISTSKIHARGPMGIKDLTSYKWIIIGEGQTRN
ncbi:MAG: glutamate-5-semialdehyde dehydrogenase [SAR202 cluster bacterium]|nr:glutamate-5-semialdehyde dehydrogenase [Chloroflexota bacterium]MQG51003.1 glutamate-5-semialdehyde dehydrogenase [SAR202 cluster bacterium]|tara:strand:- start:2366 stop:3637 length:1272 start_codon:yes stop_codon:yes gene_type:complete